MVRKLAKVSEKQGGFVVMDDGTLSGPSVARFGERYHLEVNQGEFIVVLTVKAIHEAHVNVLEGGAFVVAKMVAPLSCTT